MAERTAERAYTIAEAAALKSVGQDTIRRAIKSREEPYLRARLVGRGYRIDASALDEWWQSLPEA